MGAAHIAGEAVQGHGHEGRQALGALLGNDIDLLAPQEGLVGVQQDHQLVQRLSHHGSVAHLLLHPAKRYDKDKDGFATCLSGF